jgi:hypothetical protein
LVGMEEGAITEARALLWKNCLVNPTDLCMLVHRSQASQGMAV